MERVQRSRSFRSFRRYVSKANGADKIAIFFWLAVDFAWCQEAGELGMGAAAVMMVCCAYKLSITQHAPHEVLHACSVLLWASGNISWMYMELGQARRKRYSDYPRDGEDVPRGRPCTRPPPTRGSLSTPQLRALTRLF